MKAEEKKLFKNSILLFMGSFASKILVFLLVPLYTSILTTEEYGIADLMTTTVSLVYPMCTLMISTAVLRFCMDRSKDKGQVFSIGFWVACVGVIACSVIGFFILRWTSLAPYAVYFIPYLIFYASDQLFLQYAKGCEKVPIYALASVINTVTLIVCNILFLLVFRLGIHGYVAAMVAAYGVTTLFLFLAMRSWKVIVLPKRIDKALGREMIRYSFPLMPNSISWWITNSSNRYIMAMFCNLSMIGLYSAAYKIPSILTMVTSILMSAWELSAVDDFGSDKSRKFFASMHQRYFDMLLLMAVAVVAMVKPLASILFQNEFYQAWVFVPLLVFATVFNGLSSFIGTVFTASRRTSAIFTTTLIGAGVNIACNLALIPFMGGQGAAIATVAGYLVIYVVRMVKSQSIIHLDIPHKRNAMMAALLLGAVVLACLDSPLQYAALLLLIIFEWHFIVAVFVQAAKIAKKLARKLMRKGNGEKQ